MSKIFGIGLTKSGTRSLTMALTILGYKAKHYPWSLEEIEQFDATLDIPVSCRFKELDQLFPGSKFILTHREYADWIKTVSRKPPDPFKPPIWKMYTRLRMYNSLNFDWDKWTKAYHRHHRDVHSYFKDRNDLLTIELHEANKWEKLCGFLGKEVPAVEYPWEGKTNLPTDYVTPYQKRIDMLG